MLAPCTQRRAGRIAKESILDKHKKTTKEEKSLDKKKKTTKKDSGQAKESYDRTNAKRSKALREAKARAIAFCKDHTEKVWDPARLEKEATENVETIVDKCGVNGFVHVFGGAWPSNNLQKAVEVECFGKGKNRHAVFTDGLFKILTFADIAKYTLLKTWIETIGCRKVGDSLVSSVSAYGDTSRESVHALMMLRPFYRLPISNERIRLPNSMVCLFNSLSLQISCLPHVTSRHVLILDPPILGHIDVFLGMGEVISRGSRESIESWPCVRVCWLTFVGTAGGREGILVWDDHVPKHWYLPLCVCV